MITNRFDKYEWRPTLYSSAGELSDALKASGCYDKQIRAIHPIGTVGGLGHSAYVAARQAIAGLGVPYEDIDSGKYPYIDQTLIPRKLTACEPTVVVFEDGSTVELLPCGGDGIKMSVGQVAPDVVDGLNDSDVDATPILAPLIGSTLNGVYFTAIRAENRGYISTYCEVRSQYAYRFYLSGDFGLVLTQDYEGWYSIRVVNQLHFKHFFDNETARIAYGEIKNITPNPQIDMVEGHDSGGFFWVMPVAKVPKSKRNWHGVKEHREEEISLSEETVGSYLYFFLKKYYDPSLAHIGRDKYTEKTFQWDLEYNVYTYDAVRKMLAEIREYAALLESDYDDPRLDELKRSFSPGDLVYDYYYTPDREPDEVILRRGAPIIVHFYRRFCDRMEAMMAHSPEFSLISFMGP